MYVCLVVYHYSESDLQISDKADRRNRERGKRDRQTDWQTDRQKKAETETKTEK